MTVRYALCPTFIDCWLVLRDCVLIYRAATATSAEMLLKRPRAIVIECGRSATFSRFRANGNHSPDSALNHTATFYIIAATSMHFNHEEGSRHGSIETRRTP